MTTALVCIGFVLCLDRIAWYLRLAVSSEPNEVLEQWGTRQRRNDLNKGSWRLAHLMATALWVGTLIAVWL